jgi:hypothetical protein
VSMYEGQDVIVYYCEKNGDFLAIDTDTRGYYLATFGRDEYEGRATAIAGLVGSVCTTGISRDYLKRNCRRVAKATVPADWRRAIGFDNLPVVRSEGQPRHDGDVKD